MKILLLSIIFILTQILLIEILTEETFDCTGYKDDSLHPMYNADNCRYYWQCIYVNTVYMRAVKRVCPAGTEFDSHLKECEISSLVNCVPLTTTTTTITTLSRSSDTDLTNLTDSNITTTSMPKQSKVLSSTISLEELFESLMALKEKSEINTTNSTQLTTIHPVKPIKHRRRRNLTLNILTSNEHKIRQFSLNQTHGLLIHCKEIRRRQLRDIIFPPALPTNSTKFPILFQKIFIMIYCL